MPDPQVIDSQKNRPVISILVFVRKSYGFRSQKDGGQNHAAFHILEFVWRERKTVKRINNFKVSNDTSNTVFPRVIRLEMTLIPDSAVEIYRNPG